MALASGNCGIYLPIFPPPKHPSPRRDKAHIRPKTIRRSRRYKRVGTNDAITQTNFLSGGRPDPFVLAQPVGGNGQRLVARRRRPPPPPRWLWRHSPADRSHSRHGKSRGRRISVEWPHHQTHHSAHF